MQNMNAREKEENGKAGMLNELLDINVNNEFYDFPDETGILSRHEQLFRKEYEKGAIELKHIDVYKIQGYQDLTNRLQSTMNNNIFMNIEELSDKVDGLVKSDKNAILAEKVVFLEKENEFLRDEYTRIEKSYQLLSDRLDAKDETDSTNILLITQQMRELQEAVEIMRKDTKLEREMTDRFEALEKADDFLRENQTQHAIKLEGINGDCKRVTTEVNETELPKLAQNCNNNIQIIRNEAEIMNNEIKSMKPKIDLNTENIQGISRVLSPMEDEVSVLSKGLNINVLPNLSSINTGLDKVIHTVNAHEGQLEKMEIETKSSLKNTTTKIEEIMTEFNYGNRINALEMEVNRNHAEKLDRIENEIAPRITKLDNELRPKIQIVEIMIKDIDSKLRSNIDEIQVKVNNQLESERIEGVKRMEPKFNDMTKIVNDNFAKLELEIHEKLWPYIKEMDHDYKAELKEKVWPSVEGIIADINLKMSKMEENHINLSKEFNIQLIENQNEIVQTILPKLETINSEVDRKISHSINLFKTENNTEIQNKIQLNLTQYSEKQNSEVNDKLWDKINEVESKTLNSEVEIFEKLWPFIQSMDSDVKEELADKIWPEINNCKELQIKISEVENKTSLYQQDANKDIEPRIDEVDSKANHTEKEVYNQLLPKMNNIDSEIDRKISVNINNFKTENNTDITNKILLSLKEYKKEQESEVNNKIWEKITEIQAELYEKLWPYVQEMDKDNKVEMTERLWPELNKVKKIEAQLKEITPKIKDVEDRALTSQNEIVERVIPKLNTIDSEIDKKISVNINNFKTENNTDITNKILLSLNDYKKEQDSEVNEKIWERLTEIQAELYDKLWPYVQEMDKDHKIEITERLWPELNKVKDIEVQLKEITPKIKDVEDRALTSQNEIVERVIPKLNTIDSEIDKKISVNINNFKTENNTDITNKILLSLNDYKKEQDSEVNEKIWERLTEIQAELYDKLWPYVQEMDKDNKKLKSRKGYGQNSTKALTSQNDIVDKLLPQLNKLKDIEVQLKEITPKIKDVEDRALTSQNEIVERVIPKLNTIDSEIDRKISVNINNFKTENNTDITNKILLSLNDYKKEQDSEVNEKLWDKLKEIQSELFDKLWPYVQEMDKDHKIEITERLWPELNKVKDIEVQLKEITPKIKDKEQDSEVNEKLWDKLKEIQSELFDKLWPYVQEMDKDHKIEITERLWPELNKVKDIEVQLKEITPKIKDVEDRALTSQNEIVERVIPKLNTIDSEIDKKISVNINNFKTENNTDITNKILLSLNDYKKEQDSEEMDKDHKIEITERLWPELNKVKDIEVQLKEITPMFDEIDSKTSDKLDKMSNKYGEDVKQTVINIENKYDTEIKNIWPELEKLNSLINDKIDNQTKVMENQYSREINEKLWPTIKDIKERSEKINQIERSIIEIQPQISKIEKDSTEYKSELFDKVWPTIKSIDVKYMEEIAPQVMKVENTYKSEVEDKVWPKLNSMQTIINEEIYNKIWPLINELNENRDKMTSFIKDIQPKVKDVEDKVNKIQPQMKDKINPKLHEVERKCDNLNPKLKNVEDKFDNLKPQLKELSDTTSKSHKEIFDKLWPTMKELLESKQLVEPKLRDLEPKLKNIEGKVEKIHPMMKDVEHKIDNFNPKLKEFENLFGKINPKLSDVEKKVDNLNPKLKDVEAKVDNIKPLLKEIWPEINSLQSSLNILDPDVTQIKEKLVDTQNIVNNEIWPHIDKLSLTQTEQFNLSVQNIENMDKDLKLELQENVWPAIDDLRLVKPFISESTSQFNLINEEIEVLKKITDNSTNEISNKIWPKITQISVEQNEQVSVNIQNIENKFNIEINDKLWPYVQEMNTFLKDEVEGKLIPHVQELDDLRPQLNDVRETVKDVNAKAEKSLDEIFNSLWPHVKSLNIKLSDDIIQNIKNLEIKFDTEIFKKMWPFINDMDRDIKKEIHEVTSQLETVELKSEKSHYEIVEYLRPNVETVTMRIDSEVWPFIRELDDRVTKDLYEKLWPQVNEIVPKIKDVHARVAFADPGDLKNKIESINISIDDRFQEIYPKIKDMTDKISFLEPVAYGTAEKLDIFVPKLDSLELRIDERTSKTVQEVNLVVNERFGLLEPGLAKFDQRLTILEPRVSETIEKLSIMEPRKIETKMSAMEPKSDDLEYRLADIEPQLLDLSKLVKENVEPLSSELEKHIQNNVDPTLKRLESEFNEMILSHTSFKQQNDIIESQIIPKIRDEINVEISNINIEIKERILPKIFSLEEQHIMQIEKVHYVEALQDRVNLLDDQKQRSEALIKESLEDAVKKNRDSFESLKQSLIIKMEELDNNDKDHWDKLKALEIDTIECKEQLIKSSVDYMNISKILFDDVRPELDVTSTKCSELFQELYKLTERVSESSVSVKDVQTSSRVIQEDLNERYREIEKRLYNELSLNSEKLLTVRNDVLDFCDKELFVVKGEINEKIIMIDSLCKSNESHVENLRGLNTKLLDQMKEQLQREIIKQETLISEIKTEASVRLDTIIQELKDSSDKNCAT
ncbi:unnamed protein product [Lepeophtheirus salmonis]|uniref:(salmon louse) hypothetical protein n=1 Tax=Lepeophtheirus salmonis TaxID=72036 RepID=A0A7R8CXZ5_LEPSM|nr:unnamed protein product [Lepeophtheirus salmonis]CAF2965914.1 unnamed protein product [Lepeophtheirus salmonis]